MKDEPVNLKRLIFSPDFNPLLESRAIEIKRRYVKTGVKRDLADAETGEVTAASVIQTVEEKDDAQFVKIFAAGVAASYELTKTGQKVFSAILTEYERTPMSQGFADSIYLAWFGDGLCGRDVGTSEKTFQRGLKELLGKNFLAPKAPNMFWVNPSLFFKGDRVLFVREYRRKRANSSAQERQELDDRQAKLL